MNILDYLADKLSDLILLFDDSTDIVASGIVGQVRLLNDENHVTEEEYEERIKICNKCDDCVNETCRLCGCPIKHKAKLKESKGGECPNHFWKELNN